MNRKASSFPPLISKVKMEPPHIRAAQVDRPGGTQPQGAQDSRRSDYSSVMVRGYAPSFR
ncbi:MAG: hypothetical protein IJM60_01695 [Bacteroidales bacterium]|nr:hypothetical protein [Bacteroidales bacterium]